MSTPFAKLFPRFPSNGGFLIVSPKRPFILIDYSIHFVIFIL
ncbi:hypothetical protein HMPREF0262_00333 [Clostridium sp. ATCC 29733]|nr:hypothetical protein HMPREF0262_00333 [Clostridium sp. ATCC 29733]